MLVLCGAFFLVSARFVVHHRVCSYTTMFPFCLSFFHFALHRHWCCYCCCWSSCHCQSSLSILQRPPPQQQQEQKDSSCVHIHTHGAGEYVVIVCDTAYVIVRSRSLFLLSRFRSSFSGRRREKRCQTAMTIIKSRHWLVVVVAQALFLALSS